MSRAWNGAERYCTSKPAFNEELAYAKADPLVPKCAEFDFDAVYRSFGEPPEETGGEFRKAVLEAAAQALRLICEWALEVKLDRRNNQYHRDTAELIGRRMVALAWVANPDLFEDAPSLTTLAKRFGVTAPILSVLTSEATRVFGIENRAQAHGSWRRAKQGPANAQNRPTGDEKAPEGTKAPGEPAHVSERKGGA